MKLIKFILLAGLVVFLKSQPLLAVSLPNPWFKIKGGGDLGAAAVLNASAVPADQHLTQASSFIASNSVLTSYGDQGLAHPTGIPDWQDRFYASTNDFNQYDYQNLLTIVSQNQNSPLLWPEEELPQETGVYLIEGDFELTSRQVYTSKLVLFINGNLNIRKDIEASDNAPATGLVFIVKGNVNIFHNVRKLDAVFIFEGEFNDKWNSGQGDPQSNFPLAINGALISLGQDLILKRNLGSQNQNTPAETINFQPQYLILFQEFFGPDGFTWREVEP